MGQATRLSMPDALEERVRAAAERQHVRLVPMPRTSSQRFWSRSHFK